MFSTSFNVEISFKILTVRNLEEQKHHLGQYLIFLFLFGNLSFNIQQGFIYVVKAMVFPVVLYGCESWTINKAEHWKNWCIQIVVLEKTLESPLDSKEIKPVNPKENQPWIFIEGQMLKLKLQYFGHLLQRADSLEKTLILERLRAGGERGDRGWDGWVASLTQ